MFDKLYDTLERMVFCLSTETPNAVTPHEESRDEIDDDLSRSDDRSGLCEVSCAVRLLGLVDVLTELSSVKKYLSIPRPFEMAAQRGIPTAEEHARGWRGMDRRKPFCCTQELYYVADPGRLIIQNQVLLS